MQSVAPATAGHQGLIDRRAAELFRENRQEIFRSTGRLFAALLAFQWWAGIVVALLISPRAWAGQESEIHLHAWAAVFLGGAIVVPPIVLALYRPCATSTRHAVAVGQMLMGALLIHLTGGRIETHFHIFGSLALLAFYRDWRVLVTASAVVMADHLIRGISWPYSAFGILAAGPWRWAEHSGWVLFQDVFLIRSCVQGVREMRAVAERQARLEVTRDGIEREVRSRTAELQEANRSLAEEVAERALAEAALRESDARFRCLCACSPVGIFTTDINGYFTYMNPMAQTITGHSFEQALGDGWQRFIHEDDSGRIRASWRSACEQRRGFDETYRYRNRELGIRWAHVRSAPMRDDQGRFIGHVGTIEDTTARKAAEEHLTHQASHDALTGLPNRASFQQSLEREVASARDREGRSALLMIDLDRFKEINDTFGHHFGDAVLCELNPRIRGALRCSDVLARLGGDEFAVLLPDADEAGAVATSERILEFLKRPIVVEGRELDVGASIGIAHFPGHGAEAFDLMRHADVAMYAAKRDHGGYRVYSDDQDTSDPRRLTLITELRQGIADGQLVLYYQPKIDLRTMRIDGAEALIRWRHPREGLMQPDRFVPLAEHAGLIRPLGLWVLRDALRRCRSWHGHGLSMNIAVNLAPKNLQDPGFMQAILRFYKTSEDLLKNLTVEITEGTAMEQPEGTREVLGRLHALGVRIAIDDFGTGNTSLAYLRSLPVDEVKIDRCFVKNATASEKDACIVRSVIDLGHNLGLRVVAEGVEDRETLDLLIAWGCDVAQGHHFSHPMPAGRFEAWATGPGRDRWPLRMETFPSNQAAPPMLDPVQK